jgi:transcriptional regulator with XRE-family HTH domain
MNVRQVGSFIRDQRTAAKLSLRKMATLAGVSIPYLSQVERGLRKPSAEILQAIAKALRISAETLYVEAGILEERPASDVGSVIMADPDLTAAHKQALLQIYEAFREEGRRARAGRAAPPGEATPVDGPGLGRRSRGASSASSIIES